MNCYIRICKIRMLGLFIIGLAILFFGVAGVMSHNFANAGTGLTIQPVKVSHTIEPGQSVSGVIFLKNESEEAVRVDVKVEDFIPTAGGSGVQFVGRAPGVSTVRDWVELKSEKFFIFQKNESKEIPYTIKAPSDAEPGSHFGVAFFKATKIADSGEQLKVGTQVGMLIFVTIPGNRMQKGEILDFSSPFFVQKGPVVFKIKFENTGTVHFEPKGEITITNVLGKKVGEIPVEGQVVLPTGARDLAVQWGTTNFLLGRYKAALNMQDGEGNVLTADAVSFYAFPLWYLLGSIVGVLIIFYGLKFLKNRVNISISVKK